jgi:hypothetical protein
MLLYFLSTFCDTHKKIQHKNNLRGGKPTRAYKQEINLIFLHQLCLCQHAERTRQIRAVIEKPQTWYTKLFSPLNQFYDNERGKN